MEALGIQLVVLLVFGAVCAMVASSRGRSPVGWFCVGFACGCIGLVILLVIPDLKVEEARRRRLEKENRRLKEQLRKDRQVADRRYVETDRRLEVHDQALGVDTSGTLQGASASPVLGSAAMPGVDETDASDPSDPAAGSTSSGDADATARAEARAAAELERATARFSGLTWYYYERDEQVGPLDFEQLKEHWSEHRLDATSLVWSELMSDWQEVRSISMLQEVLSG